MHDNEVPDQHTHTTAWFASIDQAREAVIALERSGIESGFIELAHKPPSADPSLVDRKNMGWMGSRALVGSLIGAILGAAIGVLIVAIFGSDSVPWAAGWLGGGIFGAMALGFYAVAIKLPVNEESFDAMGGEPLSEDWVAVSGPDSVREKAARIMDDLEPLRLDKAA